MGLPVSVAALFDVVLAAAILWLAWQALHGPHLFRAVLSFMVFGLLLATAWVRLDAPDIALAEAAIGSGVTGALLLSTLGRLPMQQAGYRRWPLPGAGAGVLLWALLGLGSVAVLGASALRLPVPGLGGAVHGELGRAGLDSPINAVLLNFRAFDTLLEITVLFLAVVVIWSLGKALAPQTSQVHSPLLPVLVRLLMPVFVLVGIYLLWRGSHAPGGAFPAGAVLGAGGVLMLLAGISPWRGRWGPLLMRCLLVSGLGVFVTVGLAVMLAGQVFLQYPLAWASALIVAIEIAATVAIGAMLTAFYLGGEPGPWQGGR